MDIPDFGSVKRLLTPRDPDLALGVIAGAATWIVSSFFPDAPLSPAALATAATISTALCSQYVKSTRWYVESRCSQYEMWKDRGWITEDQCKALTEAAIHDHHYRWLPRPKDALPKPRSPS